ncbi:MarR family winged helix-turn-helix transcriptional regulator [Haloarcula laminariae]|uniref:MarR family winged helix-turn-helix transcriptional regulator n=1 Tax=Haloarcula laminariae TaxID=2961577 RepID=UPI0021C6FA81|nr:MarR family winged helix-turn-helix transcriptional regulator [Halomicroarcula laminariae]
MSRGPDPAVSRERVLEEFVVSPDPAFITKEIAEKFDVEGETARNWLNGMVEAGLLDRKKPGERTVIYWITDEGRAHYADHRDEL